MPSSWIDLEPIASFIHSTNNLLNASCTQGMVIGMEGIATHKTADQSSSSF